MKTPSFIPLHLATNIDGSRRWTASQGLPLDTSYDHCFRAIHTLSDACIERGVLALTLHVVRHLERTIRGPVKWREAIDDFARLSIDSLPRWQEHGIRLHLMGDIDGLPEPSRSMLVRAAQETRSNEVLHLSMAINYSSRSDGIQAARRLVAEGVRPEEITDEMYEDRLWSGTLPRELRAVQMLVITGGVPELDDFMQRESALANLYFSKSMWPAFSVREFDDLLALHAKQKRQIRSYETSTVTDDTP